MVFFHTVALSCSFEGNHEIEKTNYRRCDNDEKNCYLNVTDVT